MDKDIELEQAQKKLEDQDSEICQHQQQQEKLQQKYDDIKKTYQLEIKKINDNLASNTEELFQLRIHNKTLLTKIKKLKHSRKIELSNEDLEGRILEKEEENRHLRNLNKKLEEQIEKLKDDKKSQEDRFEKIQSNDNLLRNKVAQI